MNVENGLHVARVSAKHGVKKFTWISISNLKWKKCMTLWAWGHCRKYLWRKNCVLHPAIICSRWRWNRLCIVSISPVVNMNWYFPFVRILIFTIYTPTGPLRHTYTHSYVFYFWYLCKSVHFRNQSIKCRTTSERVLGFGVQCCRLRPECITKSNALM